MAQGTVNTLLTLLRLGAYSYYIIIENRKDPTLDERALIGFSIALGGSSYFFSYATSFYVSILTSKFFRNAFCEKILLFKRHLFG